MTLLRETPKDHGLLLDHDPQGKRRLSITLAGRTSKRNGRRLQNAVGDLYDRCFQSTSTVLWKMQGKRLQPLSEPTTKYRPDGCGAARRLNAAAMHAADVGTLAPAMMRVASMYFLSPGEPETRPAPEPGA